MTETKKFLSKADHAKARKDAAKVKPPPPPEPFEHPEDKAYRLAGEAYGKAYAAEFCAAHAGAFEGLIGTYHDKDAEAALDRLREIFWGSEWKPTRSAAPDNSPAGGSPAPAPKEGK